MLTWENFEAKNSNTTSAFEQMCRQLFRFQFFDKRFVLQSSSNNPGIETEPVFHEESGKVIGFQSKYFTAGINYRQIEQSAITTVKHYAGQIDVFYLYSNKDVTWESKAFRKLEEFSMMPTLKLFLLLIKKF